MYPHPIRLHGPWDCELLSPTGAATARLQVTLPISRSDQAIKDHRGPALFRRRFGWPGRLESFERVWLRLAGMEIGCDLELNGTMRAPCGAVWEREISPLLRARNELLLHALLGERNGTLLTNASLEVRCVAYLADVSTFQSPDGQARIRGRVIGDWQAPLELYVLQAGKTIHYAPILSSSEGTPFDFEVAPGGELRVELTNGATVWCMAEVVDESS